VGDDYHKIQLIMSLRNQGIRDTRVLSAMERIPREMFVPEPFAQQAYADQSLPIECGQTISQPYVVAFMSEKLKADDRCKVLEVGTGSGYQAAILSRLCRRLYTVERYRTLLRDAEERFKTLRLTNITSMHTDGTKGWPQQAPFDRIIVTAAAKTMPLDLIEQLKVDGLMVLPLQNEHGEQELVRVTRYEEDYEIEILLPVRFVPLVEGIAKEL
jgi:protein-L-isoaspartate(D-aspartate) O-methyltransferase